LGFPFACSFSPPVSRPLFHRFVNNRLFCPETVSRSPSVSPVPLPSPATLVSVQTHRCLSFPPRLLLAPLPTFPRRPFLPGLLFPVFDCTQHGGVFVHTCLPALLEPNRYGCPDFLLPSSSLPPGGRAAGPGAAVGGRRRGGQKAAYDTTQVPRVQLCHRELSLISNGVVLCHRELSAPRPPSSLSPAQGLFLPPPPPPPSPPCKGLTVRICKGLTVLLWG